MAQIIYLLCGIMSVVCAMALFRGHSKVGNRFLLWGAISFSLLALNNIFLCIDMVVFPHLDMAGPFWRNVSSAGAGIILLFGLITELA